MVLEFFVQAVDFVFGPLTIFPAHITILLVSTLISVIILALNRVVINRKIVDEIRLKMEQLKEDITRAQKEKNSENIQKFMNELLKVNNQYMKHMFKTMVISLVIVSIFLPWLGWKYSASTVAVPFTLPLLGSHIGWLY